MQFVFLCVNVISRTLSDSFNSIMISSYVYVYIISLFYIKCDVYFSIISDINVLIELVDVVDVILIDVNVVLVFQL